MRITYTSFALPLAVLASCSTAQPEPAPAPQPVKPVAAVAPAPAPAAKQPEGAWIDWPITAGEWVYRQDQRGSLALFGKPDEAATVIIRCDRARNQIFLSRAGSTAMRTTMTLRASAGQKSYPAGDSGGTPRYLAISLSPGDIMLDRIAYSRGRFAIETSDLMSIAIPIWPEFSRVVEDCRA